MITDEIASILFETGVEDTVQSTSLVLITVYAVFDALGGVAVEMICLALHGTYAGIEEEELGMLALTKPQTHSYTVIAYPIVHLIELSGTSRIGDLVVFVVLIN